MKKNILIAILALMVVGGGGFAVGNKLSEGKSAPETTVEGTTVETANKNAVSEAPVENGASSVIEKVSSKIENLITKKDTVSEKDTDTKKETDTEKVVEVANKTEEPKAEVVKHTEKVTVAVKPAEKVTEAVTKVNKPDKPAEATTSSTAVISRDKAKSVALNHAGLKAADVRELEIELDKEKGVLVYEVSFESGKYEYDYDIDAVTGAIKFSEKEPEAVGKVNKTETKAETTKNSAEKISREKAKSIALNHAGLKEADVSGLEIELDYDKGVHVYEVSFESGRYEYDYDIDAYSGVVKFSEKSFDD